LGGRIRELEVTVQRILLLAIVCWSTVAVAQKQAQEVDVQRGPAAELYIRKRPLTPEAPVLPKELKEMLNSTEKRRDDKRVDAIGLLRAFLDPPPPQTKPTGDGKAEGMFKLAELLWEEARRLYLIKMDDFGRAVERCSNKKTDCELPKEPRIDLKEAETYY